MKYKLSSIGMLLLTWYVLALIVNREVILPMPNVVFLRMITIIQEPMFYESIIYTCIRVITIFCIVLFLGVITGIVAGLHNPLKLFLESFFMLIQSIPQVVYILLLIV